MFYISLEVTITWYALVDDTIVTYDDVYKAWFTKIFQLIYFKMPNISRDCGLLRVTYLSPITANFY